jgi:hypothetical protein
MGESNTNYAYPLGVNNEFQHVSLPEVIIPFFSAICYFCFHLLSFLYYLTSFFFVFFFYILLTFRAFRIPHLASVSSASHRSLTSPSHWATSPHRPMMMAWRCRSHNFRRMVCLLFVSFMCVRRCRLLLYFIYYCS